jgi:hypothetical protein
MVYTKKHPALLIMGITLLAIGGLASSGNLDPVIAYLKIDKSAWELTTLPYVFGVIAVAVGVWHLWGWHEEGHLDYYLSKVQRVDRR